MRKKLLASILGCMVVGAAAYTSYRSYAAYESDNTSDLLLANVEALAEGDPEEYSGYAKDYETGEGLYVTSVSGELVGSISVGFRISKGALAELKGKVEAETKDEWKMTCQKNMGCYTTCTDIDWHMGKRESVLERGC